MKSTSIKSYHECLESGHITIKEGEVLSLLIEKRSATARELSEIIPGAWKRLSGLCAKGLVDGSSTTKCPVTNKVVTLYKYCSQPNLPMVKYRRPSYKELQSHIIELEKYISALENGIAVMVKW